MRALLLLQMAAVALMMGGSGPASAQQMITGTATYLQRIALPPDAVLEAILEEVSRADAPAVEIARTRLDDPGQPPIAFSIAYDPAAIDERLTYAVRTRILVGERLMFTSDTFHRVLTRGAPSDVAVVMRVVGSRAAAAQPPVQVKGQAKGQVQAPQGPVGAHGLRLPATFTGDLACADCEAIRYHLNLWPDQAFALRRIWLGTDESADTLGRWSVDPERRLLELWDVGDGKLQFTILDDQRLHQADAAGRPINSPLPYELAAQSSFAPLDPLHLVVSGMFVYLADAARLTECRTERSYPVALEADFASLERAYLAAREAVGAEPGQPLMVSFEASIGERPRMDGPGTEPTAVVERFINVWPGETCERDRADATLVNTYWRIVRLGDAAVATGAGRREPHLLLRANEPRFAATVGCNQLAGGYATVGQALRFDQAVSTMMACPPPLGDLERRLADALAKTATWQTNGQMLELADANGQPVALLQAVYLR